VSRSRKTRIAKPIAEPVFHAGREPTVASDDAKNRREGPAFESREAFAAWCEQSSDSQDWYEAIQRWRGFRQHYPSDVWGYVKEAIARANIGAYAQATELLETAGKQFPDMAPVNLGLAEVATLQHDFGRAAALWQELRERHPELPWGYCGGIKTLLETGQLEKAERMIEEALSAFPDDSTVLIDYARCAQQRGDGLEALSRWRSVAEKLPSVIWGHLGEAEMLISLGHTEEAKAAINSFEAQFSQVAGTRVKQLREKLICIS
jgi:tetratricopeptide (TPR) repeat protein